MSATTRWWWIRHGPVDAQGLIYGRTDLPADTTDRATFEALAAQLPLGAVWRVTTLQRTVQTADAIHAARPALTDARPASVEPRFVEQDFGDWQGRRYDELSRERGNAWHRFWLAPAHEVPPGGESFAQMIERVAGAIGEHNTRHAACDIVVVAHGGTIRAAVAHALGLDAERALALSIETCSLTRLDHIAGSAGSHQPQPNPAGVWRVVAINRVFHQRSAEPR